MRIPRSAKAAKLLALLESAVTIDGAWPIVAAIKPGVPGGRETPAAG
jgi:hypothetical protein